jgi:hypothetical protein
MIQGAAINVLDYGADPTGVSDSLAAIQSAINAGKVYAENDTTGKQIYFPAGKYKVTNSINLSDCSGVHLVGAGRQSTEIFMTGTTPVIIATGTSTEVLNNAGVQDMTIRGGGSTNVNADGIRFEWGNSCQLLNLAMFSCRNAISVSHQFQTDVQNIRIYGAGADASYNGLYMGATDLTFIDNAINAYNINVQSATNVGFRIINGQGSKFVGCEAGGSPMINGWHIGEPDSGTVKCEWVHFVSCLADSVSGAGWLFRQGTASSLGQMQLANCWSGNAQDGFYVDGCRNITMTNLLGLGHAKTGVTLFNCQEVSVTSSHFLLNNEDASVANGDINIQNGSFNLIQTNICETNNVVGQESLIESGTTNSNTVANNSLFQGATIIGADTLVYKNSGFRSEGRGSATLLAANTSVIVTHGLSVTPPLDSISVTPSTGNGTANNFWISTATSTTFTINVDLAPGVDIGFLYNINNVRLGY